VGWHLTIMSHGVVLFTASARSRQESRIWLLKRGDVEIFIRPPEGATYRYA
jgi:hypothetical protein